MKNEANVTTRDKILALIDSEYESDAAFERELELPAKTVNTWRSGRSSSYMKMLPRLAAAFDVSVGEILDIPLTGNTSDLSEDEVQLLTLYRKCRILSAKQRVALTDTLHTVIELYLNSAADKKKADKKQ